MQKLKGPSLKTVLATALASAATLAVAQSGETVRIALVDPISGPFANVGQNTLKMFQFYAERSSRGNPAGVKFEIVHLDNKGSPQETLNALKAATDQGIRYVALGLSSAAAAAMSDGVNKYNERNPGKEVVYINYAAQDPDLSGSKCNFWHFGFEADTAMKMEALTSYVAERKEVKKVYLVNQNYSHGQQFSRFARESLAKRRPDVQIVGDDLHPVAQVKDFSPYIAKIQAAGADTVMSGNWGTDLSLLIKAAKEAGLNVAFYTPLAMGIGNGPAIGAAGEGRVRSAYIAHPNLPGEMSAVAREFTARFKEDYGMPMIHQVFQMLPAAMAKAKSVEPAKVARAMEGLTAKSFNGDITMRAADHRLQQGLYITTWNKVDDKNAYNVEGTGYTWTQDKYFEPAAASAATSCQMKRPI